jgi:hypothetical protein
MIRRLDEPFVMFELVNARAKFLGLRAPTSETMVEKNGAM